MKWNCLEVIVPQLLCLCKVFYTNCLDKTGKDIRRSCRSFCWYAHIKHQLSHSYNIKFFIQANVLILNLCVNIKKLTSYKTLIHLGARFFSFFPSEDNLLGWWLSFWTLLHEQSFENMMFYLFYPSKVQEKDSMYHYMRLILQLHQQHPRMGFQCYQLWKMKIKRHVLK